MKFPQQTLRRIATIIDCDYVGDADFPVLGMNEIHVVHAGILFLLITQSIMIKHFNLKQRLF